MDVEDDRRDDEDDVEEDDFPEEAKEEAQPLWYASIQNFVENVNNICKRVCKHPSWKISIDELLRKFTG